MFHSRLNLVACAILSVGTACASSGSTPTATADAGSTYDAGPATDAGGKGRIFVSTTTISNQAGKIFLAQVGGGSRVCFSITSNSVAVPATPMTDMPGDNNPCGAATAETLFDAGAATISVGIYVGGSQTPEKSVSRNVTVAGDITENIDGTLLSP